MLQLQAITKSHRLGDVALPILHGIDLTILRGESVAIVGSSGSGKSTLMTILGCLEQPSGGRYFYDACDVTTLDDEARTHLRNRRIGFVFQQFHPLPRLTALHGQGLTVVLVTHDLSVASASQRMVRLRDGRITEDCRAPG